MTKILVIDDEKGIRKSFLSFLSDFGFEVYAADSCKKAEELCLDIKFDIIIVDIILPDCNGEELILKINKFLPETVFFIHTGSIEFEIPKKLIDIGVKSEHIFHKPQINMMNFVDAIKEFAKK